MNNPALDVFMARFEGEGLTFDDISLGVQYADFLPEDADVRSRFSRNISLNIPFVSAAMDTVTEGQMAIGIALAGGVGVIHKNLSPSLQAAEVRRVKGYLNGLIESPVIFQQEMTIADLLAEKERKNYTFSGFPIVNEDQKLVGIVTSRDLKYIRDCGLKIRDVMTTELMTGPIGTTLDQAFQTMIEQRIGKLPIVDDSGHLAGLYSFHDVVSLIDNVESKINRDAHHRLVAVAAVGPYDEERAELLANAGVDGMVIDTAHGHSRGVIETVSMLKQRYPDVDIVAGNVGSGDGAKALVDAGVDGIKVGIGPGSICTTRVVAGVGIPQLTAVYQARQGIGAEVPIIADGGIKQSGDVPKALAVGANSVMMGSALAGTAESPGERILHQGRRYVVYRGMGSVEAMKSNQGSRERYSHPDLDEGEELVPQGIEGLVQYRGTVAAVLGQYVGGLRFAMGYCGARSLAELAAKAQFIRVSSAGLREAHPHDIKIIKDAPNYRTSSTG